MGTSTLCEQCNKKLLKVFSKRTKCMHCMASVCKTCLTAHVTTRHPSALRPPTELSTSSMSASASQYEQHQREAYATAGAASSDDDVHFCSPVHAKNGRAAATFDENDDEESDHMDYTGSSNTKQMLDGIEDIEVVSGSDDDDDDDEEEEEDDDEDEEEDDDEDEEGDEEDEDATTAYLPATVQAPTIAPVRRRRMSVEDTHSQHAELLALQAAVATYAQKEAVAVRAQRIAKRDSCYAMTPVPNVRSTRAFQERERFAVAYAVAMTLVVWSVYACGYVAYVRVRSELVRLSL